jgi:hypothetical protein
LCNLRTRSCAECSNSRESANLMDK